MRTTLLASFTRFPPQQLWGNYVGGRKKFPASLLLFWLAITFSASETLACERAAGVVPFSNVDGKIYLLIADHKINRSRGWAAFGGCVDSGESISSAALRELHEETRCALNPVLEIDGNAPQVTFGKFTSFALVVPYVSADLIENGPLPNSCRGSVFSERGPWAWVELSQLLEQITVDHNRNVHFSDRFLPAAEHRWFWSKSIIVINALNQQNAFR